MAEKSIEVEIINLRGLHARASSKFCNTASQFKSVIKVSCQGVTVGGCSIMGLMMLGAAKGSHIEISANGEDAEAAITALADLVARRFDEEE